MCIKEKKVAEVISRLNSSPFSTRFRFHFVPAQASLNIYCPFEKHYNVMLDTV